MGVASRRPACPLARRNAASQTLLAGQRAYTTVSRRHEHPDLHTRWLGQVNTRNQRPAAVDESDVALLEGRSTSDVYDILASLRVRPGSYGKIVKLVDHLVYTRGVRLDAFLYETLLMANSDPQGSALAVKELVKGLESQGIQKTPTLYLAALRALAVHPDYVLRGKLLDEMRMLWVSPSSGCKEAVALGLLRDCQYELAFDSLEELIASGNSSPPWLYEIFIYVFSGAGFHDEALALLRYQAQNAARPLPDHVWSYVLESCSKAFDYRGTAYIWNEMVTEGRLNPPDGTVLSVINTASRFGDVWLATDALRVLSDRNTRLATHHFEALLDTYVSQGDVVNALRALCIMASAGNEADLRSTQPLFRRLVENPGLLEDASKALVHLTSERAVPLSAFNVVLEATTVCLGLERGLDLYRSVRQICGCPPDLTTFTILLGRCNDGGVARFLVKEMKSFSIRPDMETYELLVRGSILFGDTDLALDYVSEMSERNRDWWITEGTAQKLVERGVQDQNPRISLFVEESEKRGLEISPPCLRGLEVQRSVSPAAESGRAALL